jgi:IrrE N-terminal-like domain
MAQEVPGVGDIRKEAQRLLRRAEVNGELPTPVDRLVEAAGLSQPKRSMFADLVLNEAPERLRRPMRRLKLKVRALLDRQEREIHLDPSMDHPGQRAFKTLHEVTHDILPWQRELGYADDDASMSPSTQKLFEWQANVGGAELLFQRDLFADMAHDSTIGLATAFDLAETFGGSRRAGLHRYAETHRGQVAAVVLDISPVEAGALAYRRREVVLSKAFATQFGGAISWPRVLRSPPYTFLLEAENARRGSGSVTAEMLLPDRNNECQQLDVEIASNSYNLLVLISRPRRERGKRKVIFAGDGDSARA